MAATENHGKSRKGRHVCTPPPPKMGYWTAVGVLGTQSKGLLFVLIGHTPGSMRIVLAHGTNKQRREWWAMFHLQHHHTGGTGARMEARHMQGLAGTSATAGVLWCCMKSEFDHPLGSRQGGEGRGQGGRSLR